MREIKISADSGNSRILIGSDLPSLTQLCGGNPPVVITTKELAALYHEFLSPYDLILVPDGEKAKSLAIVEYLYREFCSRKLERGSYVVSFGGGVLSDLAGFAAATYLRGLHFGAVATSLLAQVDASVGGKNGVNLDGYKNIIGTIRQAEFCLCDTAHLKTLPKRELHSGFAEVIKYGAIESISLFETLESNRDQILALDPKLIDDTVFESVAIKARIVQADETERGERRKLNFGHTIGHAIEGYYKIPHGEAVAIGMVLAGKVSARRGLLKEEDLARLSKLIERYNLPISYPYKVEEIMEGIERDKKRSGDGILMVLLEEIGRCRVEKVPFAEIREAIA